MEIANVSDVVAAVSKINGVDTVEVNSCTYNESYNESTITLTVKCFHKVCKDSVPTVTKIATENTENDRMVRPRKEILEHFYPYTSHPDKMRQLELEVLLDIRDAVEKIKYRLDTR